MKDSEVVRRARRIDAHNYKITLPIQQIAESSHPNAMRLVSALRENYFDNPAWATHVISNHLEHPELWQTGYYSNTPPNGVRRKSKKELARSA